ncbi:MAG: hypothetical protein CMN54_06630 [SAR324 cluster bacterium]|uniref:Chemotaxis receptor methyltransferase CheR N-terminal domain-containing protein n=1 Tax=SAR324 cluster bacterium TaxID=2024889 RepID=A0A2D6YJ17_9DELT|nr:hypothetical protein [SAR324 cluster bacterium]
MCGTSIRFCVTQWPPSSDEEDVLHRLLALLRQENGVDFTEYKSGSLLRRIQRTLG